MGENKYISTGRFEAFYDAIIAIIVTVWFWSCLNQQPLL